MKTDLFALVEQEFDDPELAPEIVPVDARLSVRGPVSRFVKLFERAASVTPSKSLTASSTHALLEGVAPSASSVSFARITATDEEQTISVVQDGIFVSMAGSALIPAKKMFEILKLAPEEEVKIEVIGAEVTVRSGRAQWVVQSEVFGKLPPLPETSAIEMHPMPVRSFLDALTVTRRSVSASFRPALMQASIENGHITSSDGGRLHRQNLTIPKSLHLTIPVKVMDELMKSLRAYGEEIFEMGSNESHIVFRMGEDSLIANRLTLPFPNMDNLLLEPAFSNQHSLTVNVAELKSVIQRVRINADPEFSAVFLAVNPGPVVDGDQTFTLSVRARDSQKNAAQEMLDCTFEGPAKARELVLNHRYLTDLLDSIPTEDATFRLGNDTKSVRMPLFIEDTEHGFSGIVQQMRSEWMK